jgi:hypothetical protein
MACVVKESHVDKQKKKRGYSSLSAEPLCGTSQEAKVAQSCPDEDELKKIKKEKEQLVKDLSIFDEKNNGTVLAETFSYIMKLFKENITDEEIDAIIAAVGVDDEGYISIQHFVDTITARVPRAESPSCQE